MLHISLLCSRRIWNRSEAIGMNSRINENPNLALDLGHHRMVRSRRKQRPSQLFCASAGLRKREHCRKVICNIISSMHCSSSDYSISRWIWAADCRSSPALWDYIRLGCDSEEYNRSPDGFPLISASHPWLVRSLTSIRARQCLTSMKCVVTQTRPSLLWWEIAKSLYASNRYALYSDSSVLI
jgi:hypothetical protein